jgi:hypothetical protein
MKTAPSRMLQKHILFLGEKKLGQQELTHLPELENYPVHYVISRPYIF